MKKWISIITVVLTVFVCNLGLLCPAAYADTADAWSVGDGVITQEVTSIVLESPDVDIFLKTSADKDIVITETSSSELSEDQQVHWQLDGTTLRIKYKDSFWHIFDFLLGDVKRSLTVTIPEDLVLDSLICSVASAEVKTDVLKTQDAVFTSASGDMELSLAGSIKNAAFTGASGNFTVSLEDVEEQLLAEAASGNILITLNTAKQLKATTASGGILVTAETIPSLIMETASGDIGLALADTTDDAAISTASGDVTLTLPEDADISLEIATASGDFTTSLPMSAEGHTYTCGTGAGKMKISTASGDITVRPAN